MDYSSAIAALLNLGSSIADTFTASDIRKGEEQIAKAARYQYQAEQSKEQFLTFTAPYLLLIVGSVLLIVFGFVISRK